MDLCDLCRRNVVKEFFRSISQPIFLFKEQVGYLRLSSTADSTFLRTYQENLESDAMIRGDFIEIFDHLLMRECQLIQLNRMGGDCNQFTYIVERTLSRSEIIFTCAF